MDISVKTVAKRLNISEKQVQTVLSLLAENSTVPFIARYRKDLTGGLDEEIINNINTLYIYDVELNKRREAIIEILKEKTLLTSEIELKLRQAETKVELENIYEPFKVGKKTKASEAIALGLEPLAKEIFTNTDINFNPLKYAQKFVNGKVENVEFAIEQAQFIISQWISQDPKTRDLVKKEILNFGSIVTKIKKGAVDENENFSNYYDHKESVKRIPNHRILAISRGEDKKIISYDITFNENRVKYELNNIYFKNKRTGKIISNCINDSLDRLIIPSIIREIKSDLFERAQKEAVALFAESLENMLLWPAVKNKTVMAIDPAYVHGCKIAVLDPQGNFLAKDIIYPTPPKMQIERSTSIVNYLIDKYKVNVIAIGNGTASRETEEFIAKLLKKRNNEDIAYVIVSEVGASVYSASKIAQEEFPDFSVEERSAINIGRRFLDPLNELIKIDPKSIGVGQYQHDVNQKELSEALAFKIDKIVNLVGVDLNTASKTILTYISGLSSNMAANIIEHRKKINRFKDRNELKDVKGIGPKAFEQSVGFLRIHDSENFFDRTSIHPESYKLAQKICEYLGLDLSNIDTKLLQNQDINQLAQKMNSNIYDVSLILESLMNPTKDIRDNKEGYKFKKDILNAEDIVKGMILDGSVQSITDFGVFVYVGVKNNVLIHVSNMKKDSNQIITHPREILKVGDNIKVEILENDLNRNRIQGKLIYN
ncbi:ranscription accessory protein TEX [Mycoplasmopsis californica HAZ160_1]|uniref:Transcription accessory protein TEX n=2 Tax=Mycoplasmopsis californica TaxID=2113 RepID=A0A059XX52_9BACT|nr:Tex-like N-terminal domain-containing protein [Mycoplasmopsis californica]AIA29777.1 transcription accessory protein TEX [Mycoplasmopsis californica]BAP00795.1 ranscription accessory protein TEX [Mycoplasmopsis californica HAZ160_1]BBG40648.1 ranscription accessory protein TEX [Mycoplasmopsis californica]BBG41243.1 ranscription accessory protein TEX [Mycoplasmopsis californica]BBG41836.1 ranscription accessory protein TEX [Mycoplasmopsis californica]